MPSQLFSETDAIITGPAGVNLEPRLGRRGRSIVRTFARAILGVKDYRELLALRETFSKKAHVSGRGAQAVRVAVFMLFDLKVQGWTLQVTRNGISGKAPKPDDSSPEAEKRRLRDSHLHERDNQLRQRSVREFIRKMEQQRMGPNGWVSIMSVMRDGQELAEKLRAVDGQSALQVKELKGCISPYLQVAEPGARCSVTGLKLSEIWRYFRHTWTTPYNSTPGRKMWILVRDRAVKNHPIIGIAAIGSAVMQLSTRDAWIGWRPVEFIEQLRLKPDTNWAHWVRMSLHNLIDGVYRKDFLKDRILTASSLRYPDEACIDRLLRESVKARKRHQKYPRRDQHKGQGRSPRISWNQHARLDLFRAKRAESLAELLAARMKLRQAGFRAGSKVELQGALNSAQGRRAIETILKHVKASHVGIDMLDITICGAVAPYNSILGGKLVSLLLMSPEIVRAYTRKYAKTPSIIASSMAGRPVRRAPTLVLLGTTSLYGVNPSQYNRLRLEAVDAGGIKGEWIHFQRLGKSEGFGSYHLSNETVREVEMLLAQSHPGTRVNSIFGEGVNPKLRKLRAGVDMLGLDSNVLLNHRSSRVVYGIPLASNFREILLGRTNRPKYVLPHTNARRVTEDIATFWMRRWLANRIVNSEVLEATAAHSLSHPVSHGARVILPPIGDETSDLATHQCDIDSKVDNDALLASSYGIMAASCGR